MTRTAHKTIRIGAGQGFRGDTATAALDLVRNGDLSHVAFDVLSELTLSELHRARKADPSSGYVRDIIPTMRRVLPFCVEKNIRIITNAGGLDPEAAASALLKLGHGLGLDGLRVGVVTGDDIAPYADELHDRGVDFRHASTGESAERIFDQAQFACAYLGSQPVAEALEQGADVVVTGRVVDPAMFLAPAVHALGWAWDDWDKLAVGTLMGHILEGAGQVSGGNFSGAWNDVPQPWSLGYPLAELDADGNLVITKTPGSGGLLTPEVVAEQVLYEVHDPANYLGPDVVVDLSQVTLEADGPDRVVVRGVRGKPKPDRLKVIVGFADGWVGEGRIGYGWPDALAKARRAEEIIRHRFEMTGIRAEEICVEYQGVDSLLGPLTPPPLEEAGEVYLRVAVRTRSREDAERVALEFPYLALNGPPGVGGPPGLSGPRELLGIWPALVPRELIERKVRVTTREVRI